jgi:hypothetical protein
MRRLTALIFGWGKTNRQKPFAALIRLFVFPLLQTEFATLQNKKPRPFSTGKAFATLSG